MFEKDLSENINALEGSIFHLLDKMKIQQIIVIPARMKGTRLPGKPLIDLMGKPMIWHVWNNCVKVLNTEQVYVATED